MSRMFKIVLILLIIASIASATLAVIAFIGKEREYMKRLLLEDKLAATLKDKKRLEAEMDATKKVKELAEAKLVITETKLNELTSELEEQKDRSKSIALDLAAKENEIMTLNEEIDKEKKEKLSISKKLGDLEFEYEKAKKDITSLRNEKTELEKKISDLKESSVDLDKIVVNPPVTTAAAPPPVEAVKGPLKGRVLVVNTEYSFVVTDLGQNDGITTGMLFEIRDGDSSNLLGKAEINKVYDTMSSATVLPGGKINEMKKGNLIIESR